MVKAIEHTRKVVLNLTSWSSLANPSRLAWSLLRTGSRSLPEQVLSHLREIREHSRLSLRRDSNMLFNKNAI